MKATVAVDPMLPDRLDLLDGYLDLRESRFADIREECEKKIIWCGARKEKTSVALVYLHGFSASRMEAWPLCDRLAESLGANLFYTRLSGHGQDGRALGAAKLEDWLADGLEAMAVGSRLGVKVILVGTSTGGTLATWLAVQPGVTPLLHSLVLISPNFFPKNPLAAAALWPPAWRLFEKFFGGWRSFSMTNAEHARYWTLRYPLRAIATMMRLVRLSWQIDLKKAGMPLLMILNPWDRVINVTLAMIRFRAFPGPGKKRVFFRGNRDPGRHVLAGDVLTPDSTAKVAAIIETFLKNRS